MFCSAVFYLRLLVSSVHIEFDSRDCPKTIIFNEITAWFGAENTAENIVLKDTFGHILENSTSLRLVSACMLQLVALGDVEALSGNIFLEVESTDKKTDAPLLLENPKSKFLELFSSSQDGEKISSLMKMLWDYLRPHMPLLLHGNVELQESIVDSLMKNSLLILREPQNAAEARETTPFIDILLEDCPEIAHPLTDRLVQQKKVYDLLRLPQKIFGIDKIAKKMVKLAKKMVKTEPFSQENLPEFLCSTELLLRVEMASSLTVATSLNTQGLLLEKFSQVVEYLKTDENDSSAATVGSALQKKLLSCLSQLALENESPAGISEDSEDAMEIEESAEENPFLKLAIDFAVSHTIFVKCDGPSDGDAKQSLTFEISEKKKKVSTANTFSLELVLALVKISGQEGAFLHKFSKFIIAEEVFTKSTSFPRVYRDLVIMLAPLVLVFLKHMIYIDGNFGVLEMFF